RPRRCRPPWSARARPRRRGSPGGRALARRARHAARRTALRALRPWESNPSGYVVQRGMTTRFHGLTFVTDPGRVFSPRATTERLVDAALARLGTAPARVADVGTGSGAVAITLALRAPAVEVWASDTCGSALRLASLNAERLGAQVHLVNGDLLDGLPRDLDLIVANLPYLPPQA